MAIILRRAAIAVATFVVPIATWAVEADSRMDHRAYDGLQVAEIGSWIDDAYELGDLTSAADKRDAVQSLLADAPTSDAMEQYVMYLRALALAVELKDFEATARALDELNARFRLTPDDRAHYVFAYLKTKPKKSDMRAAVDYLGLLVKESLNDKRFDEADEWIAQARLTAEAAKTADVVSLLDEMAKVAGDRRNACARWQAAESLLESKPDDQQSHLTVGQWLAVFEQDWDAALGHLAAGGDGVWANAARAELSAQAASDSPANAFRATDGAVAKWFEVCDASEGESRLAVAQHVLDLLNAFTPERLSEAQTKRWRQQLATAAAKRDDAEESLPTIFRRPRKIKSSALVDRPTGKWRDLLGLIELPDHALLGRWERRPDGSLVGLTHVARRVMAPYALTGSYRIALEFTRMTGRESINVHIPVGDRRAELVLSGWHGEFSGFQRIDGKQVDLLARSGVPVARNIDLRNGHSHRVEVEVHCVESSVSLQAFLDDKPLTSWSGSVEKLSSNPFFALPHLRVPGVSCWDSEIVIHRFEVMLEHNGHGQRLPYDWGRAFSDVAKNPPSEIATKCETWNGRPYFVSDHPMNVLEAQQLAHSLQGRLLTTSSPEEDAFIRDMGRGRTLWMAGWRCESSDPKSRSSWRDERNRPLSFLGEWARAQPDNFQARERFLGVFTVPDNPGWNDFPGDLLPKLPVHACIEWGEEYPEDGYR